MTKKQKAMIGTTIVLGAIVLCGGIFSPNASDTIAQEKTSIKIHRAAVCDNPCDCGELGSTVHQRKGCKGV